MHCTRWGTVQALAGRAAGPICVYSRDPGRDNLQRATDQPDAKTRRDAHCRTVFSVTEHRGRSQLVRRFGARTAVPFWVQCTAMKCDDMRRFETVCDRLARRWTSP